MKQEKIQKILKIIGYVVCLIQLIISVITSVYIIRVKVFSTAQIVTTIIVLLILLIVCIVLQRWTIPGIIGKFLSILISAVLVIACFYIDYTYNKVNDMSGVDTKIDNVNVYVLIDDPAQDINDAKDYTFGILKTLDRENTNNIISDIENEVNQSITIVEYNSVQELVQALYDGSTQSIILNSAYIGFISDNEAYTDFESKVRIIFNKDYETIVSTEDNSDYLNEGDGIYTFLVNGVDTRGKAISNSNSDVNILMVVNKNTHQILMITTPRDFYIPTSISDGANDKLAHTGAYGIDVTIDTLEMLYNVNIDDYVRINFDGFVDIVDALNGVTVYSEYDFTGYDNDVLKMSYHYNQGYNDLNGLQALLFVRERHAFMDGDRQRGKNQMALIEGIINKVTSADMIKNYTTILDEVSDSVVTSMDYDEIADWAKYQLAEGVKWEILKYSVTGADAEMTTFSTGDTAAYVMIPDEKTIDTAKEYLQKIYENEIVIIKEETTEE